MNMDIEQQFELISFGILTHWYSFLTDTKLIPNTSNNVIDTKEQIGDDASIVALTAQKLGINSAIIGTDLSDDESGKKIIELLNKSHVNAFYKINPYIKTSKEVSISDPSGSRTFFWERNSEVLSTLSSVNLSIIDKAKLLYVDWYDGDYIIKPMQKARDSGISVFLNLEDKHSDESIIKKLLPFTTICQVTVDKNQKNTDSSKILEKIMAYKNIEICIVTLAKHGSIGVTKTSTVRIKNKPINVIDTSGAGATFSAGFITGYLKGWKLNECMLFASAAANLKCINHDLAFFELDDVLKNYHTSFYEIEK